MFLHISFLPSIYNSVTDEALLCGGPIRSLLRQYRRPGDVGGQGR